jgi:hypothetical protein
MACGVFARNNISHIIILLNALITSYSDLVYLFTYFLSLSVYVCMLRKVFGTLCPNFRSVTEVRIFFGFLCMLASVV